MSTTASLAKHPIHPMLIPLPMGLWIFSLAADLIHLFKGGALWSAMAAYTMAGGVIGALLAALPGFVDLFTMKAGPTKKIGIWHMSVNLLIVVLYVANFIWRSKAPLSNGPVGLSCAGIALLVFSGWLGGEMVYVRGVGVEPTFGQEDRTRQ